MVPHNVEHPGDTSIEFVADPELAEEVEKRATPSAWPSNGVLFQQGQAPTCVYFVKSGEVVLAIESGDRMLMCIRAGPGSLVGLPAIIGKKPYSMTAAPYPGADIREISGPEFLQLITEKPALSMKVLELLAAEVRLARRAYLELFS